MELRSSFAQLLKIHETFEACNEKTIARLKQSSHFCFGPCVIQNIFTTVSGFQFTCLTTSL